MKDPTDKRLSNPFHEVLVTELLEDPGLYRQMFSEEILVGETLEVFRPVNVALVGPQGTGKSMILNLIRYTVVSDWIDSIGSPPQPLREVTPYFGISINLIRAAVHSFGRRSVSKAMSKGLDFAIDAACVADYLNQYLFREFLKALTFTYSEPGRSFRNWLNFRSDGLKLANEMKNWDCWFGYYADCLTTEQLFSKCTERLSIWKKFLNSNIDTIPKEIWETKTTVGDPLHAIGNFLAILGAGNSRVPFFVVIDQYGELPGLNQTHGTELQRIVNTLIKARDPVVFYKIGARTYEWGQELRVWGSESKIEVHRDFVHINLNEFLMRNEDSHGWIFPRFAQNVAFKRTRNLGPYNIREADVPEIFGNWDETTEAWMYFRKNWNKRKLSVLGKLTGPQRQRIRKLCGPGASPLDLFLAAAWVLQQTKKQTPLGALWNQMEKSPWQRPWWRKERVGIGLLQVASHANQKRRYFGWRTIYYLSGGNITAFLLLCSEIWDAAAKVGVDPLKDVPLLAQYQAEGVYAASEQWLIRDRNEPNGRKRYEVICHLGALIHEHIFDDRAISNPGHTGFSLDETEINRTKHGPEVLDFLNKAVDWAMLEERIHTSKNPGGGTRRKWYLHPLLSPRFAIPFIRVKEPLYTKTEDVHQWIYGDGSVRFSTKSNLARNHRTQP